MPSVARRMFLAPFALLLALTATPLDAQQTGTIRGRVTEAATQRPIENVTIMVAGSPASTLTNAAGEFVLGGVAAGNRELVARRVGYARRNIPVEVTASLETRVDFTLTAVATQLDEIVVTGTGGSAERRTVGNSISTIDVADLAQKTSVISVTEVLQAKAPGVTILPGSGVTGTAGEIRIRGAGSLSGYQPVVYIDGVRYNIDNLGGFSATGGGTAGLAQSSQVTSALNNLNPNDIESIEVIKGPAAATLYGAEAANGVIQIITKQGTRGRQQLRWGFRSELGTTDWHLLPEDNYLTCTQARIDQVNATTGESVYPGCQGVAENTILRDNPLRRDSRALRTGDLGRYSVNLRGGGDRYNFYLAGDRDIEQGVFYNSDNSRTSLRSNFGFSPNDQSDIAINVNWSDGRLRLPIQDESANGLLLSARRGQPGFRTPLGEENMGWRTISPPRANVYRNFTESERFTLGATVNYTPFPWFRNRLTAGFDNVTSQAQLLFLPGDIDVGQDPDAASGANLRRTPMRRMVTIDYLGSLSWNPRPDLTTTTSFGSQLVSDRSETLSATGIGIGAPDVTLVHLLQRSTGAEGFSENNSVGFYVQEQVGWRDRLFITGALRADDHSSFGANFDAIVYPKFSVAYVISDEAFAERFLDPAQINSLKLRAAWGRAGRAPSAYSAPQTYTVDRVTLGTTTGSALRTAAFGNPDLKPETGEEIELGFDAGLLGERVGIDFTYYNKTTTDLLQSISVPPSSGFISTQLTNLGKVTNTGLEVALFGTPYLSPTVAWDTRFSVATNKNELVSFGIPGLTVQTPGGQAYGAVQQHREGYPLGGYWVAPPQRDADGAAVLTPAGAAVFETERQYYGPSSPTREIGFSNTITLFGHVRLYALFDYKGGHYLFNLQERNRCQTANDNCWRVNDPRARFPQTAADSVLFKELAVYRSASISPEWIQKADFIKLREVSLTLDLPQRYLQIARAQSASLVLSGRNLAVWSDYEGVDPEVNTYGGRSFVRVDAYAAPMMRRLTAAINLQY